MRRSDPRSSRSDVALALALAAAFAAAACSPDDHPTGAAPDGPPLATAVDAAPLAASHAAPFIEASLRNGEYAGGRSDIAPLGGLVDGPDGVTFVSATPGGRSEGIVSWNLASLGADRAAVRASGSFSLSVYVHGDAYVPGEIVAENYGFGSFRNGQGTFGFRLLALGPAGRVGMQSGVWLQGFWDAHAAHDVFAPDAWHSIGFSWGDTESDYVMCLDGEVVARFDLPPGRSLPWGHPFSAQQMGVGYHHERGFQPPASAAGVTVADFRVWDHPVPACGTEAQEPENTPPVAVDDVAETAPRTPVVVPVLANDLDAEGDPLTVVAVTPGSAGSVSVGLDGTVTYAPFDVATLVAGVDALSGLGRGNARSLLAKLEAAERSYDRGNGRAAAGQIGAFVNALTALARTGRVDPAAAAELVARARLVLDPPPSDTFEYTVSDGELTDVGTVTVVIVP